MNYLKPQDIFWSILHHFETMSSHCWLVFAGESNHCRVSQGGAKWISQPSTVSTNTRSLQYAEAAISLTCHFRNWQPKARFASCKPPLIQLRPFWLAEPMKDDPTKNAQNHQKKGEKTAQKKTHTRFGIDHSSCAHLEVRRPPLWRKFDRWKKIDTAKLRAGCTGRFVENLGALVAVAQTHGFSPKGKRVTKGSNLHNPSW